MGLFVVGRLASRHGVKIMLRDGSGGGVRVMTMGWRAAQDAESAPHAVTASGLPKRVPMAHYVPGRVERAARRQPTQRSPEAIRGVLSSFRSGLAQGR